MGGVFHEVRVPPNATSEECVAAIAHPNTPGSAELNDSEREGDSKQPGDAAEEARAWEVQHFSLGVPGVSRFLYKLSPDQL